MFCNKQKKKNILERKREKLFRAISLKQTLANSFVKLLKCLSIYFTASIDYEMSSDVMRKCSEPPPNV